MLDSLVRVSRRAHWPLHASVLRAQIPRVEAPFPPRSGPRHRLSTQRGFSRSPNPRWPAPARQRPPLGDRSATGAPWRASGFPLNNFKHYLTLFSKFFSSFPHGTCSLSVSRQYLVLDGTYHQLRAEFPNNPTLRWRLVQPPASRLRGSHPLRRPFPGHLGGRGGRERLSRLQFAGDPEIFKLDCSRFARRY